MDRGTPQLPRALVVILPTAVPFAYGTLVLSESTSQAPN
jgi:hypothetical protein